MLRASNPSHHCEEDRLPQTRMHPYGGVTDVSPPVPLERGGGPEVSLLPAEGPPLSRALLSALKRVPPCTQPVLLILLELSTKVLLWACSPGGRRVPG